MAEPGNYSDAEIRAIIERALQATGASNAGLNHSDLLAIGEQVGISAEAMTRAAQEVAQAQLDTAATNALRLRRRRWLMAHAAVFALINGLLFGVNALTTPGEWWALFPIFFWGLALAFHAGIGVVVAPSKGALKRERLRLETNKRSPVVHARVESARLESAAETPDDVAQAVHTVDGRTP